MRASVTSLSKKLISTFFAATLTLGLVPATAFAVDDAAASDAADSIETLEGPIVEGIDTGIGDGNTGDIDGSNPVADASASVSGEGSTGDDAVAGDDANQGAAIPAGDIINQTMPLEVVAQQESTRSYFLAQTLESIKTVPIVSANLPLDKGTNDQRPQGGVGGGVVSDSEDKVTSEEPSIDAAGGSGDAPENDDFDESDLGSSTAIPGVSAESTVVGSFGYRGITYAVEPGGESVAVVAADYTKLPFEFIEAQTIALPSMVTSDGLDFYTVSRIADRAFAGFDRDTASSVGACFSLRDRKEGTEDDAQVSAASSASDLPDGANEEPSIGITAITVPASITEIGDDAFSGFDTLQYVIVSEDNPTYSQYDGVLYDAELTRLLLIPEGRLGAVRVAPSVTELDPEVFSHCPSVKTLVTNADSAAYQLLSKNDLFNASGEKIESLTSYDAKERGIEPLQLEGSMFFRNTGSNARLPITQDAEEANPGSRATYAGPNFTIADSGYTYTLDPSGGQAAYTDGGVYEEPITVSGLRFVRAYSIGDFYFFPNTPEWETTSTSIRVSRTGYTFDGWTGSFDLAGTDWSNVQHRDEYSDGSVQANWRANVYTRTLITDRSAFSDGSSKFESEVTYDSWVNASTAPIPEETPGYTFNGYWTAPSGGTKVYHENSWAVYDLPGYFDDYNWIYTNNLTLYAQWTANPYSIQFDGNGKNAAHLPSAIATAYDLDVTLEAAQCPGYTFKGWNTVADGSGSTWVAGTYKNLGGLSNDNEAITLYAQWQANPYSIQFDANGKNATGMPSAISTKYDEDVTIGSPACSGYTFLGWNTAADGSGVSWAAGVQRNLGGLNNDNEIVTLYAQWRNNDYDVTFDSNMDGFDPITVVCIFDRETPELDAIGALHADHGGYRFAGYYDENGDRYYSADGTREIEKWNKAGAAILMARWTYDLVLDENADSDAVTLSSECRLPFAEKSIDGATMLTVEVVKGRSIALYDVSVAIADLAARTRGGEPTGYALTGFYVDDALTASFREGVPPAPNARGYATLHLGWRANEYRISFDGNEGSGGQVGKTAIATYDASMPEIDRTMPVRAGWSFAGWYDAGVGGSQYYDAAGGSVKHWDRAKDATLYAQWTQNVYCIEFVASGPEGEAFGYIDPIADVVYGEVLSSRTSSTYALRCTGYDLIGWSTDDKATELDSTFLFNGKGEGIGTYAIEGSAVLYPIWKARTVTVVFDPNMVGGERVETAQTFGASLEDVPAFQRFGYDFAGWYRDPAGTIGPLDATAPFRPSGSDLMASSIDYFAKWVPVSFTVTLYPGEHGSYAAMWENDEVVADPSTNGGYKYEHTYTVEEGGWPFVRPKAEGGYSFAGWQQLIDGEWVDCAGSVDAGSFEAGSALVFRARWAASEASITLDLNGALASEQMPGFSDTLTYSINKQVVLPIPIWAGHTFQGWKLVERGGVKVEPAEDIATVVAEPGTIPESLVCKASWVTDVYTIRFLRSSAIPTEIASAQSVGRDDDIVFAVPAFKEAFDVDRTDDSARIFKNYRLDKATAGTGKNILFYPGDAPTTMAALLKAYPNLKDSSGKSPANGSTIIFYADWNNAYRVEVPLKASIAFDPERIVEDPLSALKPSNVVMRLPDSGDADPIEIVSLICEPTSTTESAFDSNKAFYDHVYLTLSAKRRSVTGTTLSETAPVELNLGAIIANGSLAIRDVKNSQNQVLSLPDIGFTFGGEEPKDRILDLTFGIKFDGAIDSSKLVFLNAPAFKDTGSAIDLANVYYTLAMKR